MIHNLNTNIQMPKARPRHNPFVTIGFLITGILLFSSLAGWITHLIVAITAKAWLFMIVGALIAPVAVLHGWSVWLGFDWLN